MSLNVRPILSALLRNRTGAVLVALQVAIALAVLGAVLGLALASLGLTAVHHMYAAARLGERGGYQELTHFDVIGVVWAVVLAVAATLAAGLYPAWRIGRLSPAVYLKSQ